MTSEFDTLIFDAAGRHGVDPALIKAIIQAESNFNPRAFRHEPFVKHLGGPDASYGLMQTLYTTAREMGYTGVPEGLFNPETSIEYGTRYLKRQLIRYTGDTEKAISAYNAGSARRLSNGKWSNQPYVDRVLRFFRQLRAIQTQELKAPTTVDIVPGVKAPAFPPVRLAAGEDEAGRRLVTMETVLTPQSAPWVLGGLAVLGALVFSRGR